MNTYIKYLLITLNLLMLFPLQLMAISWTGYSVEYKAYAFIPVGSDLKRLFPSCAANYEIEIGKTYGCNIQGWLDVGYITTEGDADEVSSHKPRVNIVPVSVGGKYVYHWNPGIDLYIGAGPAVSFIRTNAFSAEQSYRTATAAGGIGKVGLLYQLNDNLYANLSCEGVYQYFTYKHRHEEGHTSNHRFNFSGVKLGGGFGFIF